MSRRDDYYSYENICTRNDRDQRRLNARANNAPVSDGISGAVLGVVFLGIWYLIRGVILPILALFCLLALSDAPCWAVLYLLPLNAAGFYLFRAYATGKGKDGTVRQLLQLHLITLAGGTVVAEIARQLWMNDVSRRQFRWSVFVGGCLMLWLLIHIEPATPPSARHAGVAQQQHTRL